MSLTSLNFSLFSEYTDRTIPSVYALFGHLTARMQSVSETDAAATGRCGHFEHPL